MIVSAGTLQFQIIGGGGGGGYKKGEGGLKNILGQKRQPVVTIYGCSKLLLIIEKHQYNFLCGLHLYIKENRAFLITNLSSVNTKSCLRNQTPLCIHLLVLLVPSQ